MIEVVFDEEKHDTVKCAFFEEGERLPPPSVAERVRDWHRRVWP
jgi:hypothetical protein